MPVRRPDAVARGVAPADDDDVLAARVEGGGVIDPVARHAAVLLCQVVHRVVDAVQVAARQREVAGEGGSGAEHHGVERVEHGHGHRPAEVGVRHEADPLGFQHGQPPGDKRLRQLEVRYPVAQQAAHPVVPLEDDHAVPGAVELIGAGQPRRAGPDDGDRRACPHGRRLRSHPAFRKRPLDDGLLDVFDGHGCVSEAEHTGALARGGADASGELGEVVRGAQPVVCGTPLVSVNQIVPVRDQVAERASGLAERDPAIHAPRRLLLQGHLRERQVHFVVILHTLRHGAACWPSVRIVDKSGRFSHGALQVER